MLCAMGWGATRRVIGTGLSLALCSCRTPPPKPAPSVLHEKAVEHGKISVSTLDESQPRPMEITIAVLPFRYNGTDKSWAATGLTLSDLIAAQLAPRQGFKLVERERLKDLYDEMALGDVGQVDAATAVKIGKLAGANVIALGSFGLLGQDIVLAVRLVKVDTGELIGGISNHGAGTGTLRPMAESTAARIAEALRPAVVTQRP